MLIATVSTIISLIFLIAFVAAMIILQVYLSRRESKLPANLWFITETAWR